MESDDRTVLGMEVAKDRLQLREGLWEPYEVADDGKGEGSGRKAFDSAEEKAEEERDTDGDDDEQPALHYVFTPPKWAFRYATNQRVYESCKKRELLV